MAIPGSGDVVLLYGQDSDGNLVPLRLNADGTLSSTGSSLELGSIPTTQAIGDAAAAGASVKAAPELHKHGMPAFGSPASSAVGDASADGSAATLPHSDHKHARESFGASAAALGTSAAGVATTPSRSDHVHQYDYILVQDQKAQNTVSGTFTLGDWRTRDLNTEVTDTGGHASVASNQITLAAGTYRVRATAPTYQVQNNQLRLQNITDGTTLVTGQVARDGAAGAEAGSIAVLVGQFTIAAQKVIELQHRGTQTSTNNGFGVRCNFTTEIYASIELWKVA